MSSSLTTTSEPALTSFSESTSQAVRVRSSAVSTLDSSPVVFSNNQFHTEQQARLEAAAFSSLYDTVVAYFFSCYGYPRSVAQSVVSKESVREACAVPVDGSTSRGAAWIIDDNCTLDEVARQLKAFVSREEYTYFLYYVAIAVPLITLAIVFNTLAVVAVCRIRRRQPRHVIAISLSVSDVILSATTLIKRCGVVEVDDGPLSDPMIRNILEQEVNVVWQSAFAMSAVGLVCLAADNLIAVAAPFHYGSFSNSSWITGVMPALWSLVLIVMIGLRIADLNYSVIVQYVVAAIICTLLFVILTAYGFTCFQALLYRRRTDRWAQPEQKITLRRRLLKGFFTTTLLVLTCLLSWGPLVCYLLVDEEDINAAHPVFLKFLLFSLVMFHLGAVLNPIIYSMRIRGIRTSLFQILKISSPSSPSNNGYTINPSLANFRKQRSEDLSMVMTNSNRPLVVSNRPGSRATKNRFERDGSFTQNLSYTFGLSNDTSEMCLTDTRQSAADSLLGFGLAQNGKRSSKTRPVLETIESSNNNSCSEDMESKNRTIGKSSGSGSSSSHNNNKVTLILPEGEVLNEHTATANGSATRQMPKSRWSGAAFDYFRASNGLNPPKSITTIKSDPLELQQQQQQQQEPLITASKRPAAVDTSGAAIMKAKSLIKHRLSFPL